MEPEIRPGGAADLPQLVEIYNYYVRETPITFDVEPFSVEDRRPWLEQFARQGCHRLYVAVVGSRVLGYAGSHRFRAKPAYDTSVETTVYCAPDARGQGIGHRLYSELFAALAGEDLNRAYAGVTLPNAASVALHEAYGFRHLATYSEVGRKFARYWDVAWFEKPLAGGRA
jgi:phosphinothricin acetyltransferase